MSTVENETLLKFPCDFAVKALGLTTEKLTDTVLSIVQMHIPATTASQVQTKKSRNGKYLSVTVHVIAESKKQLDDIYLALSASEEVTMIL